jgi:hypothetical protein
MILAFWRAGMLPLRLSSLFPIVVGLVGVLAFINQFFDSRENSKRMQEIAGSMSTQYSGPFPMHLRDIINLVNKAQERVWILADCVDYGGFSAVELHKDLVRALEDASRREVGGKNVEVILTLYGPAAHISQISPFYGLTFEQLCAHPTLKADFEESLVRFLEWNRNASRPTNDETFRSMLMDHHRDVARTLDRAGMKVFPPPERSQDKPGVFFWIGDDEAVFVLLHTGGAEKLAFRTRDSRLVDAFKDIFRERRQESEKDAAKVSAGSAAQAR